MKFVGIRQDQEDQEDQELAWDICRNQYRRLKPTRVPTLPGFGNLRGVNAYPWTIRPSAP